MRSCQELTTESHKYKNKENSRIRGMTTCLTGVLEERENRKEMMR